MIQHAHKKYKLYRQAMLLAKEIYHLTEPFPDTERAVLIYTLRRLAALLCQNLATAAWKKKKKRKAILKDCLTTCIAIDTQLELALSVALTTPEAAHKTMQYLNGLYKKIRRNL